MKTFGVKTLIASCILVLGFLVALLFIGNNTALAITLPAIIGITQIIYAPVIRISKEKFSVATPNPFSKNIHVNIDDVDKIAVHAGYTMRFVVHMKNGKVLSITTGSYSVDLRPMYEALLETGVTIEGTGYRTTDWA